MAYNRYPAVDDEYNFPPEVRLAFSNSSEVKTAVVNYLAGESSPLPALVEEAMDDVVLSIDGGDAGS